MSKKPGYSHAFIYLYIFKRFLLYWMVFDGRWIGRTKKLMRDVTIYLFLFILTSSQWQVVASWMDE